MEIEQEARMKEEEPGGNGGGWRPRRGGPPRARICRRSPRQTGCHRPPPPGGTNSGSASATASVPRRQPGAGKKGTDTGRARREGNAGVGSRGGERPEEEREEAVAVLVDGRRHGFHAIL